MRDGLCTRVKRFLWGIIGVLLQLVAFGYVQGCKIVVQVTGFTVMECDTKVLQSVDKTAPVSTPIKPNHGTIIIDF